MVHGISLRRPIRSSINCDIGAHQLPIMAQSGTKRTRRQHTVRIKLSQGDIEYEEIRGFL